MTSQADILAAARHVYVEGPVVARHLQRLRPYICPFELLVDAVPDGARVLDVGCGAGVFLAMLARAGRISGGVGFDSNPRAVALANVARARLPKEVPLRFEHRDAGSAWPEGPFDVVSMIDVMHHVGRGAQARMFSNVASRLAPGGLFIYKDMVAHPWWRAWANRLHDLVLAREWIHYLPLADAVALAAEAGMSLVTTRSDNRFWYGHELAIFRRDGI